ncbi:MAG: diguanylate cyclase [Chloroflexales bacterium]|nr:diguanylate cyclase [Chloroflexales bacterium]
MTFLSQSWAPVLARLSDAVLLLDTADGLVACTIAARALLGGAGDLPGTPARALLGLSPEATLVGELTICPPGSGLVARVELRRTPLFDGEGALAGSLLVILAEATPVRDNDIEGRLRKVALTISSALDIDLLLDRVVRLSAELIGAGAGALPLYDAQFDRLLPGHVVGLDAALIQGPLYRGSGAIWDLIDTGEAFLHNDYATDPRAMRELVRQGVQAVLGVPVVASDEILGVLILYHLEPGRRFGQRDLELLECIGRQAGVALQNARRYEEAMRESRRRQVLYKASVAFGTSLAPEQLYLMIHHTIARLMPCDTIAIALYDEPTDEIEYVYMVDGHGRWPSRRLSLKRGMLGFIVRTGLSLRITGCDPEIEALFGAEPFGEGEDATGSLLALALSVGEQTIGAITVQAVAPDAYTPDDLSALETLAATAAIALQNAHLFARVQELATIDPLTGVSNRRQFFDRARREIERAARYGRPFSLIMLDADHFKQINDHYGHVAGDQVLQAIAARCRADLREVDVIGRYGGEEFLVLLPETAGLQAMAVADRLRDAVGRTPVATDAGPVAVSISIGVAGFAAGSTGTIEELLDQVDKALYRAKAAGRNQARSS